MICASPGADGSLATVDYLFEAALCIGRLSRAIVNEHQAALVGVDATTTLIVGGQIGDEPPEILLVYPQGNYIRASDELPFLQIGEASTASSCWRWPSTSTSAPRRRSRSRSDR